MEDKLHIIAQKNPHHNLKKCGELRTYLLVSPH